MAHITFDYSKVLDKFVAPHEVDNLQAQVTVADEMIRKGTGPGADFLGWRDLPENYDREEFDRILKAAEKIKEVTNVMTTLNKYAKDSLKNLSVNSCTDITGFGLAGHAMEMAASSKVTFEIDVNKVPYIDGALEMAKMGLVPAGTYNNKDYISGDVESINIEECYLDLMYDPQTSGGLLITLAESEVENIMKDFENKNMDTKVAVIGRVLEKQEKSIVLKSL